MIFAIKDFEGEDGLDETAVFANDNVILPTLCAFHE